MTTFHIDAAGNLLRATSDPDAVVPGAVETTEIAPESGRQKWNGGSWDAAPVIDPAATPLTPEDVERALLTIPGMTKAKIDQAKRDRGKPLP